VRKAAFDLLCNDPVLAQKHTLALPLEEQRRIIFEQVKIYGSAKFYRFQDIYECGFFFCRKLPI